MVSGAQQNNGSASEDLLQCEAIFEFIQDQIKEDPKKATVIGGVYQFNITEKGKTVKQWTMDLKNAKIYVGEPKDKPTTTLLMSAEDFVKIAQGKLQPQAAFMQGKMKVTGNIMMAQKLGTILRANVAKL